MRISGLLYGISGQFDLEVAEAEMTIRMEERAIKVLLPDSYKIQFAKPSKFDVADPLDIYSRAKLYPVDKDFLMVFLSPRRVSGSIVEHFRL